LAEGLLRPVVVAVVAAAPVTPLMEFHVILTITFVEFPVLGLAVLTANSSWNN